MVKSSKSEIGEISNKSIINNLLVKKAKVSQWKYSFDTMQWFKSIPNKKPSSFVNFYIENIYPPFPKKLMINAICYAKSLINISEEEYSLPRI